MAHADDLPHVFAVVDDNFLLGLYESPQSAMKRADRALKRLERGSTKREYGVWLGSGHLHPMKVSRTHAQQSLASGMDLTMRLTDHDGKLKYTVHIRLTPVEP